MRALLLLLALVASTSAFCPPPYSWREYVFAKGHSNVTLYDKNAVLKGLRVALVSYAPLNQTTERTTLLATATTDDTGFYVIAGSAHYTCYHYDSYRLQLYYDEVANYPLSKVEIPSSYVIRDDQPVKVFESDISADYFPPPS